MQMRQELQLEKGPLAAPKVGSRRGSEPGDAVLQREYKLFAAIFFSLFASKDHGSGVCFVRVIYRMCAFDLGPYEEGLSIDAGKSRRKTGPTKIDSFPFLLLIQGSINNGLFCPFHKESSRFK